MFYYKVCCVFEQKDGYPRDDIPFPCKIQMEHNDRDPIVSDENSADLTLRSNNPAWTSLVIKVLNIKSGYIVDKVIMTSSKYPNGKELNHGLNLNYIDISLLDLDTNVTIDIYFKIKVKIRAFINGVFKLTSDANCHYGEKINVNRSYTKAKYPSYQFLGWYTDYNKTIRKTSNDSFGYIITAPATFYEVYEAKAIVTTQPYKKEESVYTKLSD